jgi:hypothetical protein
MNDQPKSRLNASDPSRVVMVVMLIALAVLIVGVGSFIALR